MTGRAPDEDLDLVADACLFECVDRLLHRRHRDGEQRREANDIGAGVLDGVDELFGGDVGAEVDDIEAAAFEHRGDEVLADVMEVALDGADDDASRGLCALRGQQRAQQCERAFHGARREQQFRHEVFFALEAFAHLVHGGNHALLDHLHWIDVFRQRFFGDGNRRLLVAVENGIIQLLNVGHSCYLPLNSLTAFIIATMFSTGVPAWMLCTESKTKPPPGAKISQRRSTSSRT